MRPFESYAIYLSLYLLWHGTAAGATPLTCALVVVVAAHLWLERPRWQLTLLYAHTAYLINATLISGQPTDQSAATASSSSWTFILSSLTILMASAALACLFPVARFPPLQGPFKAIGVVQRFLPTDFASERHARTKDMWAMPVGVQDAQRHPSLAVSAFYPSALAPHPHEATRGLTFLSPAALNALASFLSMPRALFSYVTLARIRAVPDSPIAPVSASQAKLPVVLFSHGLGGTATMYSAQVCELASQGYVVFTLTHNDGSAALAELDNNVQVAHRSVPGPYGDPAVTAVRKEQVQTRVAELSLMLDAIIEAEEVQTLALHASPLTAAAQPDCAPVVPGSTASELMVILLLQVLIYALLCCPFLAPLLLQTGEWPFPVPFAGRLDLTRIGLMGHSFGAATVTLMASKETRIKSVVAHDLWTLPLPEVSLLRCCVERCAETLFCGVGL